MSEISRDDAVLKVLACKVSSHGLNANRLEDKIVSQSTEQHAQSVSEVTKTGIQEHLSSPSIDSQTIRPHSSPPSTKSDYGERLTKSLPPNAKNKTRAARKAQGIATCPCILLQRLGKASVTHIPSEDEVKEYFQKFGTVVAIIMKPSDPNGFVLFSNKTEAQNALYAPVQSINGRFFKVIPALRAPEIKETETGKIISWTVRRKSIFLRPSKPDEVVEIPTEDEIKTHFEQFGTITDIYIKPTNNDIFIMFSNPSEAHQAISAKIHCLNGFDFKAFPTRKFPTKRTESSTEMSKSELPSNQPHSLLSQSSYVQDPKQPDDNSTGSQSLSDSTTSRDTSADHTSTAGSRCILIQPSSFELASEFPSTEAIRDHCQQFGRVIQVARYENPPRAYVTFESPSERMKAIEAYEQHMENLKASIITSVRSEIEPEAGVETWNSQETVKTQEDKSLSQSEKEYNGSDPKGPETDNQKYPSRVSSASQPTHPNPPVSDKTMPSTNREVKDKTTTDVDSVEFDPKKCIKFFIPRYTILSMTMLRKNLSRFGRTKIEKQPADSPIKCVFYFESVEQIKADDNAIRDERYWLSNMESDSEQEEGLDTPNAIVDREKSIQIFIPVNSMISAKRLKHRYEQYAKVEIVPQKPDSAIKYVVYVQPHQIQPDACAANQEKVIVKPDPVSAQPEHKAQAEVVKPAPVARPEPPPQQPIAFSSRTHIPLIQGGGTRQMPILAQPLEP
ncbi:hypothetical protein ACTXT7_005058 [Hymenolepis weldensis]